MKTIRERAVVLGCVWLGSCCGLRAQQDNIGHERHLHRHGEPHPAAVDESRFVTNRDGAALELPSEEDAFFFVVFGDRTGGPVEGVSVLADAVRDTNLLEPDFVMTVGDLVEGYNTSGAWVEQMREFKGIMDELLCPWFPVAGNHDIYWRGEGRPAGEHEADYEMNFGPLWYAFEHKSCWFIALYSDEANPETGERDFNKPECQRMSEEQVAWLGETLERAKGADHVFLFLHHPRWLGGNYGDDWEKVHRMLVEAGNVTAVFGGHIHRMRYDPRDGIEYVTLATVGGVQNGSVPDAGWLHQFDVVTVRKNQIALASLPVGEMMDVREITGSLANEAAGLASVRPVVSDRVRVERDGSASAMVTASVTNTTSRPVEATVVVDSADSRWGVWPDHQHQQIGPGATAEFSYQVDRLGDSMDVAFRDVEVTLAMDMLAPGHRYSIPNSTTLVPLAPDLPASSSTGDATALDVRQGAGRVESADIALPDGPFTLECWFEADSFGERTGLVSKTENSEYGIFVNNGRPSFSVFLDGRYAEAGADKPMLEAGRWHHGAGVFDGKQVRLYIDGELVGTAERSGRRRTNGFPLQIGADVDGQGMATSGFDGRIDEVRLSNVARYEGDRFEPVRRFEADASTLMLLHMEGATGAWLCDASGRGAHARLQDGASIVEIDP
jgi:hypothetical protein